MANINVGLNVNVARGIRELNSFGAATRQLQSNLTQIRSEKLNELERGAIRLSAVFAGLATAALITAPIYASIDAFADFEAQMRNINSIWHQSDEVLEKFGDQIRRMNTELGSVKTSTEAAAAAYEILSSGFKKASDVSSILEASIVSATAGLTETLTAAKAITGVLNSYGTSVYSAGQAADILFSTVDEGSATFEDLATSMGRITPLAAQNSIAFEEISAMVGFLTNRGIRAAEAVTGIKRAMNAVTAPTAQGSKELAKYGVTVEQMKERIADGGLIEGFKLLKQAIIQSGVAWDSAEASMSMRRILGEATALNSVFALLKDEASFGEILEANFNSAGKSMEAMEEQSKSISFALGRLRVAADEFKQELGKASSGPFKAFVEALTDSLNSFTFVMQNSGTAMNTLKGGLKDMFAIHDHGQRSVIGVTQALATAGSVFALFNGLAIAGSLIMSGKLMPALFKVAMGYKAVWTHAAAGRTAMASSTAAMLFGSKVAGGFAVALTRVTQAFVASMPIYIGLALAVGGLAYAMKQTTKAIQDETEVLEKDIEKHEKRLENYRKLSQAQKDIVRNIDKMTDAEIAALLASEELDKQALLAAKQRLQAIIDDNKGANNTMARLQLERINYAIAKEEELKQAHFAAENAKLAWSKAANDAFGKFFEQEQNGLIESKEKALETLLKLEKTYGAALSEELRAKIDLEKQKLAKESAEEKKKKFIDAEKQEFEHSKRTLAIKQAANRITENEEIIQLERHVKRLEEAAKKEKDLVDDALAARQSLEEKKAEYRKKKEQEAAQAEKDRIDDFLAKQEIMVRKEDHSVEVLQKRIDATKKLAEEEKLSHEQKLRLLGEIEKFEDQLDQKRQSILLKKIKTDQKMNKDSLKNVKEKLGVIEEEAELGLKSEKDLEDIYKRKVKLQEDAIRLDGAAQKARAESLEDQKEIDATTEQEILDLRKSAAEEYMELLEKVKQKKGEIVGKTEEQIQKEKELADIIRNDFGGAILTLDQFVDQMNKRFSGADTWMGKFGDTYGQEDNTLEDKRAEYFNNKRKREDTQRKLFGDDPVTTTSPFSNFGQSQPAISQEGMTQAVKAGNTETVAAIQALQSAILSAVRMTGTNKNSSFYTNGDVIPK